MKPKFVAPEALQPGGGAMTPGPEMGAGVLTRPPKKVAEETCPACAEGQALCQCPVGSAPAPSFVKGTLLNAPIMGSGREHAGSPMQVPTVASVAGGMGGLPSLGHVGMTAAMEGLPLGGMMRFLRPPTPTMTVVTPRGPMMIAERPPVLRPTVVQEKDDKEKTLKELQKVLDDPGENLGSDSIETREATQRRFTVALERLGKSAEFRRRLKEKVEKAIRETADSEVDSRLKAIFKDFPGPKAIRRLNQVKERVDRNPGSEVIEPEVGKELLKDIEEAIKSLEGIEDETGGTKKLKEAAETLKQRAELVRDGAGAEAGLTKDAVSEMVNEATESFNKLGDLKQR